MTAARRRLLSRGARIVWYTVAAGMGIAFAVGLGVGALKRPVAPVTVADFTGLVDGLGRTTDALGLGDHYKLVAYGYTACPEACPATLTKMHLVVAALGDDLHGLVPLFVTLDPEHDTPDVLTAYVQHFDPRIIGLTGASARCSTAQRCSVCYRPTGSLHGRQTEDPIMQSVSTCWRRTTPSYEPTS